jgi:hypothetical protein
MRWILMLMAAGGCATEGWSTTYETGEKSWPTVVAALRAPQGSTLLVEGDRGYLVRPDALRGPVHEFTAALADALEEQGFPPSGSAGVFGTSAADAVVAVPNVVRALTVGDLAIKAIRADEGTRYWATVERGPREFVYATCDGTPEVDRAWEQLAAAARSNATRTAYGLVLGPSPEGYLRDVMVDLRGLNGPLAPP